MGDTSNWEFAAVVAAVAIGLGGLLLFTLIALVGAWRTLGRAAPPTGLAPPQTHLGPPPMPLQYAPPADPQLAEAGAHLLALAQRTDALLEQQARLLDAVRNLVEAGVLGAESATDRNTELLDALARVERLLTQITTPGTR